MKLSILVLTAAATVAFATTPDKTSALCDACKKEWMPCAEECKRNGGRPITCSMKCQRDICWIKPEGFEVPCYPSCFLQACVDVEPPPGPAPTYPSNASE
ncbi:hypothetical protein G6011_00156 [Alternaria panax]|uniref:Uncharacterized protein n=1 Tax=Alternaria panax TaxID=48097 RepID=A0AAD4NTB2_9PLEO|nr:hypothetical protein G6011_00156 [Alternaria panax]